MAAHSLPSRIHRVAGSCRWGSLTSSYLTAAGMSCSVSVLLMRNRSPNASLQRFVLNEDCVSPRRASPGDHRELLRRTTMTGRTPGFKERSGIGIKGWVRSINFICGRRGGQLVLQNFTQGRCVKTRLRIDTAMTGAVRAEGSVAGATGVICCMTALTGGIEHITM